MKRSLPVVLTGLLFASQPVLSEEAAVQPEQGEVAAVVTVEAVNPGDIQEAAAPAGGTEMGAPAMKTDEQGGADKNEATTTQPGMTGQGKEACRMGKGGMRGMMPGVMGRNGMMEGGMGKGSRTGWCMEHNGISKEQYRELMGRLDVLDARMAKIDAMLERLLER